MRPSTRDACGILALFGLLCTACATSRAAGGSGPCAPAVLEYRNEASATVVVTASYRVHGPITDTARSTLLHERMEPGDVRTHEVRECVPPDAFLIHTVTLEGVPRRSVESVPVASMAPLSCRVTFTDPTGAKRVAHECRAE